METSIELIQHKDILEVKKLLSDSPSILATNIVREVLEHVSSGVALKLVVDGKIKGVWCSFDMKEYVSLSYFFIHPDIRRTMLVFKFFKTGLSFVDMSKPILIQTKDITGFERYVQHIEGNTYCFKGLR